MTALSTPARVTTPRPASGSRLARMLKGRELGILLAIGALIAITAADNSRFLSAQSLRDIMLGTAILMVLAIGQSVVVITRNIDLSVGSVLGLSAFAVGSLGQSNPELPVIVALLAGLGFGAGCGLLNGILVRFGNVPALVVTLGTLYIFRGTGLFWADGQQISADELPPGLLRFGTETVLGVPYLILVAVFVLIVTAVFLRTYRTGRRLYAMGSNPGAARLAGIRTGRLTLAVFIFSGALAGLAGVLYAARFATVDAAAGTGFELNVVAAVVVGGVAIFGGSGSVHGAALGAVLLTVIGSSLPALQIDPFWQQAVVGSLILLAIGADRLASVRAARSQRHADAQRRSLADGL